MFKMFLFFLMFSILYIRSSSASNSTQQMRLPKQGLFNVISFPNEPCRGSNGLNGTCLSASECQGSAGQAVGSCAQGFGTCCFYSMSTCGGSITRNQTYVQNPGFPSAYTVSSDTTCTYTVTRATELVCQLRFDFIQFDLGDPTYPNYQFFGCDSSNTDYVTFTPAGNRANNMFLCGYNPGQHVYIDMGAPSASPATAKMTMTFDATNQANHERYYNIMVSQIECNTNYKAPQGCDQYMFGNGGAGVIQSFNYDNDSVKAKLQGSKTICIRREQNMCVIGYTPPDVDNEELGFSISGNPTFVKGRRGCSNPAGQCSTNYIRIPQGTTALGNAPYIGLGAPPPTDAGCDRFCGKRLCGTNLGCEGSAHQTIYSRIRPFHLFKETKIYGPVTTGTVKSLKGYKLNYFQLPC